MKTSELMELISELAEFKEIPHYKVIKHRYKNGKHISLDKLEKIFKSFGYHINWVK